MLKSRRRALSFPPLSRASAWLLLTMLVGASAAGAACRSDRDAPRAPRNPRAAASPHEREPRPPAQPDAVLRSGPRQADERGPGPPAESDRRGIVTVRESEGRGPRPSVESDRARPPVAGGRPSSVAIDQQSPGRPEPDATPAPIEHRPADLDVLAAWLEGAFDTRLQAQADPAAVRDLLLHVVRIWPHRPDGPWLYYEEAAAAAPDRPHRQRVLRPAPAGGEVFELAVFALPGDPQRFAASWLDPRRLDALSPEELLPRADCVIYLKRRDAGAFVGATLGMDCPGEEFGSAYVQCDLVIQATRLEVWERFYDYEGRQIAGPTSGPLVFERDSRPAVSVSDPTVR